MKMSRREVLRGVGVLGIAAAVGCDGEGGTGTDAGPSEVDATPPPLRDAGPPPTGPFRHGVASGDPLPDAVILWTRVTLEGATSVSVEWEMATDPGFSTIVATGVETTDESRDYTVKVDATGLEPATTYYYRFRLAGTSEVSPIGRTRTAPAVDAAVDRLRFAVCSCASYAHGYFHGYRNIARRADLDGVIHLGDYIYEYASNRYGNLRPYEPPHECVTLADYRRRYAWYREDPDVREVHRQHPFLCVWDDHESANNAWMDGAENHDPATEGDWAERKRAAQQAYSEWMPIRASSPARIWRRLRFGTLAEIVLLDTRLEGRTEQGVGDPAVRRLLSEEQEAFLIDAITGSEAQWKVIAQQVMFSPLPPAANADQWDGYPAQRARILEAIRTGGLGGGRVDNVVVITGDIHMSWAIDVVEDPSVMPLPPPLAVEFVAPGITSPSIATPGPVERALRRRVESEAPHVRFVDLVHRGYFVLDLTAARAQAAFQITNDVTAPYDDSETASEAWSTRAGENRLRRDEPAPPREGAPALAP
jgi:alkaline phosphatase D